MDNTTPEKSTLEYQLVKSLLAEQRSTRRWKNFRFLTWMFLILLSLFILFAPNSWKGKTDGSTSGKSYVSLIRLSGIIMPESTFSAKNVTPQLTRAFRDKESKGVVLLINSPGGSPVQASIIHDKILQLKKKYHKQVIVVAEDTLASGSYLVATAADKIFVSQDTITGSIGVIMEGFGFEDAMSKLGVTRRVFTAGTNKDRLDPFMAIKPEDKAKVESLLAAVHQDFINDVLAGRKGKLIGDPKELFSGDFWTGTQAVKLGLADGTATVWEAMDQTFGTTYYRDYTPRANVWESVMHDISMKLPLGLTQSHSKLEAIL